MGRKNSGSPTVRCLSAPRVFCHRFEIIGHRITHVLKGVDLDILFSFSLFILSRSIVEFVFNVLLDAMWPFGFFMSCCSCCMPLIERSSTERARDEEVFKRFAAAGRKRR